jgi:uncharacterized protein (DUF4415 family)
LFGRGVARIAELYPSGEHALAKKEHIVKYTDEELRAKRERGDGKSDFARAAAMTDAQIEAAVDSDPDESALVFDWSRATPESPKPKAVLNMRVDHDVMEFFRKQGKGYQTKINAVLRSYVNRMSRHEPRG